jgi:hypothetical protein
MGTCGVFEMTTLLDATGQRTIAPATGESNATNVSLANND